MQNTHKVFNLIILDESGSMESIKKTIIEGFNEVVQTVQGVAAQYPEQEHRISLVSFNGLGIKTIHHNELVTELTAIDDAKYQPAASTPLYDAMGEGIATLRREVEKLDRYNVLVTILTDGEENASKEYNGKAIKALIEELKEKNWTFTYIGANHDVEKFALTLSITNTMTFQANEGSMQDMFAKEKKARNLYSKNIRDNKSTTDNFYKDDDDKLV
jgi:Mg-chelatase subunit ChlD